MNRIVATALVGLLAAPAFAEGDAAKGEKEFNKCKSCHMIVADDGTEIVKGGRTGPNLWGLPGRQVASVEDFRYGGSIEEWGATGAVWDLESFSAYVQDPRGYLREVLDDSKARSKMSFKLRSGAEDIWAYLVSVSPAPES